MIKYYRKKTGTLTSGLETLYDTISGVAGKTRKVIGFTTAPLADMYIRIYKNAEQIVDVQSIACVTGIAFLPMDIDLKEGDKLSCGFYNNGAATTAKDFSVVYEEK